MTTTTTRARKSGRKVLSVATLAAGGAPITLGSPEWEALRTEYRATVEDETLAYFRRDRVFYVVGGRASGKNAQGGVLDADGNAVSVDAVARAYGLESASSVRSGRGYISTLARLGFVGQWDDKVSSETPAVLAHDAIRRRYRRVSRTVVRWADGSQRTVREMAEETVPALKGDDTVRLSALLDLLDYAEENATTPTPDPVAEFLARVESLMAAADKFAEENHRVSPDQARGVRESLAYVAKTIDAQVFESTTA